VTLPQPKFLQSRPWRILGRRGFVVPQPLIVTDKLASYRLAHRELVPSVTHRRSKYLNNRAENSDQPTRVRERVMKRFASPGQAQRFLFAFGNIRGHFRPRCHRISASQWRTEMRDRFAVWHEITAAAAA
jgi:putative transposase